MRMFPRHHLDPVILFTGPSRLNKNVDSGVIRLLLSLRDDNVTFTLEIEIEVLAMAKFEGERCVGGENLGSIVVPDNVDWLVDCGNGRKLRAQCQCIIINQRSNVGKKLTSSEARSLRPPWQP